MPTLAATRVTGLRPLQLRAGVAVTQLDFADSIVPPAGARFTATRLLTPGRACGLWQLPPGPGEAPVLQADAIALDTRLDLRVGDIILASDGTTQVARRVQASTDAFYTVLFPLTSTLIDKSGQVSKLVSPPIKTAITRLVLDAALPFDPGAAAQVVVRHTMVEAGAIYAPLKDTLDVGDPVSVPALIDPPRVDVTHLLFEDVHGDGVSTTGLLDATAHAATPDASVAWGRSLWAPVELYANAIRVTRGESVRAELLGIGDGGQMFQTFRLKKSPLTYLAAACAAGRATTLVIHVGGVRWNEVDSFHGIAPDARAYIVRHDDDGHADITFGGAARLPTGASVVADYRWGAGAAAPPAGSITQLVRPVAGLRKVHNVLAAFGGADAEAPSEFAIRGPRSALLLGRAISLPDLEAAAGDQPGVRAARAAWRWDATGLGAVAVVSYIGDPQSAPDILANLRSLAEDGAPISVQSAPGQDARLDVDAAIDPAYVAADVIAAVCQALFAPATLPGTGGLLRPENLGPDGVLFASVVVRTVMGVPGVATLRSLVLDGTPFTEVGRRPPAGRYYDFEAGGVWVDGLRAP
jgi:hypothetical protein